MRPFPPSLISACFLFSLAAASVAPAQVGYTVVGSHRSDLMILQDEQTAFPLELRFRGPAWTQADNSRLKGRPAGEGEARIYRDTILFKQGPDGEYGLDFEQKVAASGEREIKLSYRITPDRDFLFGLPDRKLGNQGTISTVLAPSTFFKGGEAVLKTAGGESREPLPTRPGSTAAVGEALLQAASGEQFRLVFSPPVFVHRDAGELRFMVDSAGQPVPAGETFEQTITITFPKPVGLERDNRWVDTSTWYPVQVDNDFSKPSEIGMESWHKQPAGSKGWLRIDGDRIVDGEGNPVTLWGTNILRADNRQINREYMIEAPRAAAHYGVNINRLHAFAKPLDNKWAHMFKLMHPDDSFKFHEEHLDFFDLIFAESKKHGIYTGWSVFYGWYPTKTDIAEGRFLNWEEAQTMLRRQFPREGSFYAATAVMPDVQDLIIKWHVHLLNHVNPYTGKRYADDPALAFVELQNEENIYLGLRNLEGMLKNAPTYRQNFYDRFAAFLKEKYGDEEGLRKAWGNALEAKESLAEANITPFPNWYNPAAGSPGQRVADQYHFLFLTQEEYYLKFKAAMREAGYGGLLVGSCWQASDWIGHLYNTYLDSRVGMIDRHNYGRDHLDKPGTGLLSAGFQQVKGLPFNYSEWGGSALVGQRIASPITAFYGMGLQGWAGGQQFAWDHPGALPHASTGINDSTNPFDNLAQYMTLSRSVLRGDVKPGDLAGLRKVSLPALKNDAFVGFHEEFSLLGNANNKSFAAAVPQESLAVGRVLLEFVDAPVSDPVEDKTAGFIDRENGVVRSNTGQLLWNTRGQGWFTVNTPGTQAVIGNSGEQPHDLDTVRFVSHSRYAHLYATALDQDADLAGGKRLLVTAIGRAVPEGTVFDELAVSPIEQPQDVRKVPYLIEPIQATITLKRNGPATVTPLDQNGRKVPGLQPLAVVAAKGSLTFEIDTQKTKSPYFLVEFE